MTNLSSGSENTVWDSTPHLGANQLGANFRASRDSHGFRCEVAELSANRLFKFQESFLESFFAFLVTFDHSFVQLSVFFVSQSISATQE